MKRKIFPACVLFIFSFCLFIYCEYLHADKTKVKEENGVTVVYNPKKPDPPPGARTQLILEEDLTIGVKEGEEEYMFLEATRLDVDDEENIYILDRKASKVRVYDKNGQFLRTIGKKGQGPGEFQGPRDIYITPQKEILVNDGSTRRLLFFALDGKFLREASAGKMWLFLDPKVDSKGNIYASFMVLDEKPSSQLKKFKPNLEPISDITLLEMAKPPALDPRFPRIHWFVMENDKLIWSVQTKYEFHILNAEGKLVRKIVKDYDPVDFTEEDKERVLERLYGGKPPPSNVKLEWPKNQLAFMDVTVDDQGRLFVKTYERKEGDKETSYYDVFDREGRYIAKVFLDVTPRIWKKGKMYTFYDDEEGYRFVKRYNVIWQ